MYLFILSCLNNFSSIIKNQSYLKTTFVFLSLLIFYNFHSGYFLYND